MWQVIGVVPIETYLLTSTQLNWSVFGCGWWVVTDNPDMNKMIASQTALDRVDVPNYLQCDRSLFSKDNR
ncbi:hypothetical protein [Synechocystis sp. PCC 7509]|uniref:hypothetical protein n=1 Tax=Synechocystis sp. PCC 7509 TaxID=927677 RepID=UPI00048D4119|nr:hypothetical protein [Synechocystis sp. PCC 7509]